MIRLWPSDTEYENTGDRCAASGGYTLHANIAIKAKDRERLRHLIRYMARPSVSDERIELVALVPLPKFHLLRPITTYYAITEFSHPMQNIAQK